MDFGHFLVNHREEKIEVGSVPSGPNVGVELLGEGGAGVKVGKALPETGPLPHLFWASSYKFYDNQLSYPKRRVRSYRDMYHTRVA